MNKNDYINMEYEARLMINEKEYSEILDYYSKSYKEKRYLSNFNTYFDSEDLYLTSNYMVLRTRQIDQNKYELTLKIKGRKGDIELNHILDNNQYQEMREKVHIPDSEILDKLNELNIDINKLKLIADLRTDRVEIQYKKFLLVIDKNYYRNRIDYNVEVESYSKNAAIKYLNEKMKRFGLQYKKGYISKSRRAIFDL